MNECVYLDQVAMILTDPKYPYVPQIESAIQQLPLADVVPRCECDYWHEKCTSYEQTLIRLVQSAPVIVRCKDCKYFCQIHLQRNSSEEYLKRCDLLYRDVTDEDFCSKGVRAEDGG